MAIGPLRNCPFCGSDPIVGDRNDPFRLGGQHTNGISWMTIGCVACCFFLCEEHAPPGYRGPGKRKQWLIDLWNGVNANRLSSSIAGTSNAEGG